VRWNIELLQTFITKLDLDRRLLLQELPSLEELAKVAGVRRRSITVINEEVSCVEKEVFSRDEIGEFAILTDLRNANEFRRLVHLFRHYCLAKTLAELGYTTVSKDVVNSIMLEFPLYDPEYCKDEVRYVYERLRRESPYILGVLSRYPICDNENPLDVLSHVILDLNLVGIRGIINEFFLNFTSKPVTSVRNIIAAHLLLVSLPAISLGSLVKIGIHLFSLLSTVRANIVYSEQEREQVLRCDLEAYRAIFTKTLRILEKSSDVLLLPRLLRLLQSCENYLCRSRGHRSRYSYCVILLVPPRAKAVGLSRHVNNLGLLVKTMMIV